MCDDKRRETIDFDILFRIVWSSMRVKKPIVFQFDIGFREGGLFECYQDCDEGIISSTFVLDSCSSNDLLLTNDMKISSSKNINKEKNARKEPILVDEIEPTSRVPFRIIWIDYEQDGYVHVVSLLFNPPHWNDERHSQSHYSTFAG